MVTDGVVTDGMVTDGVVTDGVVTDGVVTDGVVTCFFQVQLSIRGSQGDTVMEHAYLQNKGFCESVNRLVNG